MTPEQIKQMKEMHEAQAKAFEDFKTLHTQELSELKKKGASDVLLKEQVDKANKAIDELQEKLESESKSAKEAQERINTILNRKGGFGGEGEGSKELQKKQTAAMNEWLRKGMVSPEERKLLSTDSQQNGGYLVTPERSAEIIKLVRESSPIRELASVMVTNRQALDILEDLDECDSGWVGERSARSETDTPEFAMLQIVSAELHASPKATQNMLDDADFDLEGWLAAKVAEKFARDEATAFINGLGIKKPRGILTYPSAVDTFGSLEQVVSGSAATITADGLIDLQDSLLEPYQANSHWLMRRSTMSVARKLKDTTNQYIWSPGLVAGAPAMLLGRPVHHASDMPAVGANNLSVAYGDFKQGYQILDRQGIRVVRDEFTDKPKVIFYTTKRVGGGVKNFQAIKIGKCSA